MEIKLNPPTRIAGHVFSDVIQTRFAVKDWLRLQVSIRGEQFNFGNMGERLNMMRTLTNLEGGGEIEVEIPDDINFDPEETRRALESTFISYESWW